MLWGGRLMQDATDSGQGEEPSHPLSAGGHGLATFPNMATMGQMAMAGSRTWVTSSIRLWSSPTACLDEAQAKKTCPELPQNGTCSLQHPVWDRRENRSQHQSGPEGGPSWSPANETGQYAFGRRGFGSWERLGICSSRWRFWTLRIRSQIVLDQTNLSHRTTEL